MTVSTTTSRVRYEGDGATRVFPIPFKFVDNAHVKVTLRDAASRETPWREGSEYRLSGAGNDSGGSLTVLTEPLDHRPRAGEVLVVALELPFTQDKAFPLGGAFPTTQVEEGLDLAALRDAQLAAFDARAFSVPATDAQVGGLELPIDSLRAGRYLGFDGAGKPALLAGTAEAADLSDKTVLPTGASAARTIADLLGLGALTAANVKLYGAKGDTAELADGTVTDGSAVLSSGSVAFTEADVGKAVWVEAAATAGKAISTIANGPIDAAWQYDSVNDSFADFTAALNSDTAGDVEPFPAVEAVGDAFYIGHIQTFDRVTFDIATSGVGGVVAWEYWDGSAWAALTVTDGTSGFTAAAGNHDLTFTPPGDWATTQLNSAIDGRRLYYIRARLTTVYTTNPVLDQAILGGGRIRITSTLHLIEPLQTVSIKGVIGTAEANGTWQVERIDNDILDLIGPSFQNAYVSGGTIHGRLETTIASVSDGDATLAANAGASVAGTAAFGYGTDDTAAIQAAIDSGKTVVVPDGNYLVSQIIIQTDRQKLLGMGGRLVALPAALHSINGEGLVRIEADFVEVTGLYIDNPTEQNKKGDSWSDTLRHGIEIRGHRSNIHHNTVRRFLDGIAVLFSSGQGTGPEYSGNIITGNIIWENLGAGSGRDQRDGIQGEASGDGIVSWGTATVITNNVVHVKEGQDARVGIHCEGLSERHDPVDHGTIYPERGCIISNNIVLAYGLDGRNGRWRRGITTEQVADVTITGNVVYGGGWHAIQTSQSAEEIRGNVTINGNVIYWSRPDVDNAGGDWLFGNRDAIAAWHNTSNAALGQGNINIQNNAIEIVGSLNTAIRVSGFRAGGQAENVVVTGNTIRNTRGVLSRCINIVPIQATKMTEAIIAQNTIRGSFSDIGIRVTGSVLSLIIEGNTIESDTKSGSLIQAAGGNGIISNNHLRGGGSDHIQAINMDYAVVNGNIMDTPGSDCFDGFGSDGILTSNVMLSPGALYTRNWTPTATKLDANNIKN